MVDFDLQQAVTETSVTELSEQMNSFFSKEEFRNKKLDEAIGNEFGRVVLDRELQDMDLGDFLGEGFNPDWTHYAAWLHCAVALMRTGTYCRVRTGTSEDAGSGVLYMLTAVVLRSSEHYTVLYKDGESVWRLDDEVHEQ